MGRQEKRYSRDSMSKDRSHTKLGQRADTRHKIEKVGWNQVVVNIDHY